jgi:hypothetical protein
MRMCNIFFKCYVLTYLLIIDLIRDLVLASKLTSIDFLLVCISFTNIKKIIFIFFYDINAIKHIWCPLSHNQGGLIHQFSVWLGGNLKNGLLLLFIYAIKHIW